MIPAGMLAQAVVFCSIQPCNRVAEGDLEFERDGAVEQVAVCPRHAEYLMSYFAGGVVAPGILSQEIVFVDDVGNDMTADIIRQGTHHAIIG